MPEKMSDSKSKSKRPRLSSEDSYSNSSSSSLSSSSDEETDAKDLKPIKEYLGNRKELASQLFKSVKADKIRMMLPQILRKLDLNDLEELCASELVGMSKKRITCIINDKQMLESSDTEESDDSGPSLEIISDTEWISDDGVNVKIEGAKSKSKKDNKKLKKKTPVLKNQDPKDTSKLKSKGKGKAETVGKSNPKVKTEKIKVEGKPKEKEKDKEGETILDLLELEMRARAIRALIRKEEGTSSKDKNAAKGNSGSGSTSAKSVEIRQVNLKKQLEKIQLDNVLLKHGNDDDVFVVIKPAPTIELLSSDSENEDHSKRVNKKLVSERQPESQNVQQKEQANKDVNKNSNASVNAGASANKEVDRNDAVASTSKETHTSNATASTSKEKDSKVSSSKKTENQKESSNLPISVTESIADDKGEQSDKPAEDLEEGEIVDEVEDEVNNKIDSGQAMELEKTIKKVKKNPHIRSRKKSQDSEGGNLESKPASKKVAESKSEGSKENKSAAETVSEEPIEIEESPKRENDASENSGSKTSKPSKIVKIDLDDDKSLDIEEIINLDDYPDDMDIIEKNETNEDETKNKETTNSVESDKVASDAEAAATSSSSRSETWASRYVKQDDVQNVIKESKMQSEIRKRLRERQRQSKLNSSPVSKEEEVSQPSPELEAPKPTGSVEEYLALKGIPSVKNISIFEDSSSSSSKSAEQTDLQSSEGAVTSKESPAASDVKAADAVPEPESAEKDLAEEGKASVAENTEANEIGQQNNNDTSKDIKKEMLDKEETVITVPTTETTAEATKPDVAEQEQESANDKSKEDLNSSTKSDSSDDGVIVRLESTASTCTIVQRTVQENTEQTQQIAPSGHTDVERQPD